MALRSSGRDRVERVLCIPGNRSRFAIQCWLPDWQTKGMLYVDSLKSANTTARTHILTIFDSHTLVVVRVDLVVIVIVLVFLIITLFTRILMSFFILFFDRRDFTLIRRNRKQGFRAWVITTTFRLAYTARTRVSGPCGRDSAGVASCTCSHRTGIVADRAESCRS